jgi:integrase/recombinase XerC
MHTPHTWAGAIALYVNAMAAANRSPGTIRLHVHYLAQLRERHRLPWSVTTEQIQALMTERAWGPSALRSARSVFRGFYRWGHGMGHTDVDPAFILATVATPAPAPRPAPEVIVWDLIDGPDVRISFMAQLAGLMGLRVGEVAVIHQSDYVGSRFRGRLRVHGKGGKIRELPVVDEHLAARLFEVEGWAFPNGHGSHISAGHASRILSGAMPNGWTAHKLRHRALTSAYAATKDLLATKEMAGHSKMDTTLAYVLMPADAVEAAMVGASRRAA